MTIQFWTSSELEVTDTTADKTSNGGEITFDSVFARIQNTDIGGQPVKADLKYLLKPHRVVAVEEVWLDFSVMDSNVDRTSIEGTEVIIGPGEVVALKMTY